MLSVFLLAGASMGQSKLHPGLRAGYTSYLGSELSTVVVGAELELERSDAMGFRLAIDVGTGNLNNQKYAAFARDTALSPTSIIVAGDTKFNIIHAALDGRKYLGKGTYETGGVYGFLGVGTTIASATSTYDFDGFSENDYSVTGEPDEQSAQQLTLFMLRGGLGYEFTVGSVNAFVEGKLNFPANNADALAIPVDVGPNAGVWLGVRL